MSTITVTNIGKAYKLYQSRWARFAEWILPGKHPRHSLKWVLKDINFIVQPGEAVGIIGINGAGKSTLLKLIAGTIHPTTGSIRISGRVAALLELGMGFHPDFTGRQNVYMSGQLMGYSIEEIKSLMPEIEDFAEIGEYIDQPMRVYSSGMQMRLAFSVATASRPDILIVDEALSVGDTYFQHKSFDRIRQFSKQGTTLLIVSHDKQAIQSVCNFAILFDGGRIAKQGKPEAVMDYYNAMLAEDQNQKVKQKKLEGGGVQTISGNGLAKVEKIVLLDEKDSPLEIVEVGQTIKLKITVSVHADLPELTLGYVIKDRIGQDIFGTNTYQLHCGLESVPKGSVHKYTFKFLASLGPGSYSISTALHAGYTHVQMNYEWKDRAFIFNVVNITQNDFVGNSWLPPQAEHTLC